MYDLEIRTKYITIHISVEKLKDIKEVLSMPYVISYEKRKVNKPKYKLLNKSFNNQIRNENKI